MNAGEATPDDQPLTGEAAEIILRVVTDQLPPRRRAEARGILRLIADNLIGDDVVIRLADARRRRADPVQYAQTVAAGHGIARWLDDYLPV